jgi:hypothetical protein
MNIDACPVAELERQMDAQFDAVADAEHRRRRVRSQGGRRVGERAPRGSDRPQAGAGSCCS